MKNTFEYQTRMGDETVYHPEEIQRWCVRKIVN